MKKWWTVEQLRTLRRLYDQCTAREIAAAIGKPIGAVYHCCRLLDLPTKAAPRCRETKDRVRALYQQGRSDQEIANELGLDRRHVTAVRSRQGLPALPVSREKQLQAIRKQRETLGIRNSAELRSRAYQRYARQHGLPEDLPFRAVQVVYAIARHGPQTIKQLREILELRYVTHRNNGMHHNRSVGQTYTAELTHRRIVLRMRRAFQTGGRGRNFDLYDLTPEWRERITNHVLKKSAGATGPAA